jgi:lipooligosaccharide transport system ATP-binding protein
VYGEGVSGWLEQRARALCDRAELHGETAFCYVRDASRLVEVLRGERELRFLHRRANLEDLFLKLTGREMRE